MAVAAAVSVAALHACVCVCINSLNSVGLCPVSGFTYTPVCVENDE